MATTTVLLEPINRQTLSALRSVHVLALKTSKITHTNSAKSGNLLHWLRGRSLSPKLVPRSARSAAATNAVDFSLLAQVLVLLVVYVGFRRTETRLDGVLQATWASFHKPLTDQTSLSNPATYLDDIAGALSRIESSCAKSLVTGRHLRIVSEVKRNPCLRK